MNYHQPSKRTSQHVPFLTKMTTRIKYYKLMEVSTVTQTSVTTEQRCFEECYLLDVSKKGSSATKFHQGHRDAGVVASARRHEGIWEPM